MFGQAGSSSRSVTLTVAVAGLQAEDGAVPESNTLIAVFLFVFPFSVLAHARTHIAAP